MRLSIPIIILFLLSGAAAAQISSDRERFDIELHPGEVVEKILTLTNTGDSPISDISRTSIGGIAKDLIYLEMPDPKILDTQDKEEIKIFFAIPPETEPGTYTGFMYLIDSSPPSMPLVVEFHIDVLEQESYGLSLSINDAKTASTIAKPDESAKLDLEIRNTGQFRDVASINSSSLPSGWMVSLLEGDNEVSLPYDVPLAPGTSHDMKLIIRSSDPGRKGLVNITAMSMGNNSKISAAQASVQFGIAIRAYKANVEVPEKLVVNRTYNGAFSIELGVEETIKVGVFTPPNLMVIPLTQVISVSPDMAGVANFTLLANQPGEYPVLFRAVDSNGIPLPDEIATITAVEPSGTSVVTSDTFLYRTLASLAKLDNRSIPVVLISSAGINEKDRESLLSYSQVFILGNKSVVPSDAERSLADVPNVTRIEGTNIGEMSWRFISEIWKNGTAGVIVSTPRDNDVFKAYQEARSQDFPLVICDSPMTDTTRSIIQDLAKRSTRLSQALIVGKIPEDTIKALKDFGISVKEVAQ
jgi:putative cell wall-binding protein